MFSKFLFFNRFSNLITICLTERLSENNVNFEEVGAQENPDQGYSDEEDIEDSDNEEDTKDDFSFVYESYESAKVG